MKKRTVVHVAVFKNGESTDGIYVIKETALDKAEPVVLEYDLDNPTGVPPEEPRR